MTAPTLMVGAVIVEDGRAVGEGYHQRQGSPTPRHMPYARLKKQHEGRPCM